MFFIHDNQLSVPLTIRQSGQVYKGTWNGTEVAVKVLTTETGIRPSSAVRP